MNFFFFFELGLKNAPGSPIIYYSGNGDAGWLTSMQSEIFLEMKFIIFQSCPSKQAAFLPGQPLPYNQLLILQLLLVLECYFTYIVEAKVLAF